ncbi:MAG: TIR domain-containing protein [Bryobacterales bacterium]|nr:TIR domain-containing protein [Bryobacterales bacterium]
MSKPGEERRDFFISFNSADRAWAEWIAFEVEKAGYRTYFQHWDFAPGSNFVVEMHRAARQSERTIVVLSADYLKALFTQPEWAAALVQDPTGSRRTLVPLRVKECQPDGLLAAVVYENLVGLDEAEARAALRKALDACQGGRAKPASVAFPGWEERKPFPGRTAGPDAPPPDLRNRAVALLEAFFLHDGERARQTVLGQAFGACPRNPARDIEWGGSAAVFASHAVDTLLSFGCAERGKHALSLLLETMATIRGRQMHPDYAELPPLLDAGCRLPTRAEEVQSLSRLIGEIEARANRYSPLGSSRRRTAPGAERALPLGLEHDPSFEVLRHRRRQKMRLDAEAAVEVREYSDTRTAFQDVARAMLLGKPGSGKSTTLRRHALDLANQAHADVRCPVPMMVDLGNWTAETPFQEFLSKQIPEIGWGVAALGRAKRLVLLLDGMNEMPTALRAEKTQEIAQFLKELPAETPVVISCRAEDYEHHAELELDTLTLEPLTPERVRTAARHWAGDAEVGDRFFWELAGDPRLAEALARWEAAGLEEEAFWRGPHNRDHDVAVKVGWQHYKLWRQHRSDPRNLLELASNPFMFTMLFMIWWESRGALPRNRSDLFSGFVDALLHREHLMEKNPGSQEWRRTADGQRLVDGLQNLAWAMQRTRVEARPSEGGDFGVLTVVSRESAVAALGDPALLKKAVDGTFLDGTAELRFRHQLLQEYFTALALKQQMPRVDELWLAGRWWERSGWEEAAVLLAGSYSEDCTEVIRWLRDAQPEVAAKCYLESGAEAPDKAALLRELKQAWMPRLTDPKRGTPAGGASRGGAGAGASGTGRSQGRGREGRGARH